MRNCYSLRESTTAENPTECYGGGGPAKGAAVGQLGTAPSAERFKEAIKPMDKASEAILALRPLNFHYKKEVDPQGLPQFGLIAEEVEK
jgi:hypothetical protein